MCRVSAGGEELKDVNTIDVCSVQSVHHLSSQMHLESVQLSISDSLMYNMLFLMLQLISRKTREYFSAFESYPV